MTKLMHQLREMSSEALEKKIHELKAAIAKDKSLIASGTKLEKPGILKKNKKEIARSFTLLRERELFSAKKESKEKKEKK